MSVAQRRGFKMEMLRPHSPSTVPKLARPEENEIKVNSDGTVDVSKDFPPVNPTDLEIFNSLGAGISGNVFRCRYIPTNEILAVKKIQYIEKREILQGIVSELHALRVLKHPNIIRLFSAFYAKGYIHILMSLVDGGSLADFLKVSSPVPERALGRMCWFCLQGLLFLRKKLYLHRDLKPSNILISKKGEVQLADFGMARQLTESHDTAESFLGTMCYMAPERIIGDDYGYPSDIWGLGMIIYECAIGKFPIGDPTKINVWNIREHFKSDIEVIIPPTYSDGLRDFISRCLKIDETHRDKIENLVEHPWAKQFSDASSDGPLLEWVTECVAKREELVSSLKNSLDVFGISAYKK